jgi:hypothetical protein
MAKMNIYIPDELRARMDQAGDRNWSAMAQRAFELECHLVEVLMDTEDSVIQRLRASKAKEDDARREYGQRAGRQWAREGAEYSELRRVANVDSAEIHGSENAASNLAYLILDGDTSAVAERDLWEALWGATDTPPNAWVEGFTEGVWEVWEEVGEKI